MGDFKGSFKDMEGKKLIQLLQKQSSLADVPDEVDRIVFAKLDEKKKLLDHEKNFHSAFNLNRLFAMAALAVVFISVVGFIWYLGIKHGSMALKLEANGEVYINNRLLADKPGKKYFSENDSAATGKNSTLKLKVGYDTVISLGESTGIKILKIDRKNRNEFSRVYLDKGKINCSVKLPSIKSRFEILTSAGSFTVKGTEFSVEIRDNRDVALRVNRGVVESALNIGKSLNLDKIKNHDPDVYGELSKILDYKISVGKNETLVLKSGLIDRFNRDLTESLGSGGKPGPDIINDLESLHDGMNRLTIHSTGEKDLNGADEGMRAEKIYTLESGVTFSGLDTIVSSGGKRFIFIACNKNKTLYCFDVNTNKLKWKLTDKKIKNITAPAVFYNDKIVLGTPDGIFVISTDGKIVDFKTIARGPNYWSSPVIAGGRLLIPGFETVYTYDGANFSGLNSAIKTNGQIYLSYGSNLIFYSLLNEKKIKIFDLANNRIADESFVLADRVFMPPAVDGADLYIADISGNIYKFDRTNNSRKILKIDAGIISQIVYSNDYLYFIANDGYFYRAYTPEFNRVERLARVDYNQAKDSYLSKKIIGYDGNFYYCSNTGKLFIYDTIDNKSKFMDITENNAPLIGSPVVINGNILLVDSKSNVYRIRINF